VGTPVLSHARGVASAASALIGASTRPAATEFLDGQALLATAAPVFWRGIEPTKQFKLSSSRGGIVSEHLVKALS
jgi:hypothetical protein